MKVSWPSLPRPRRLSTRLVITTVALVAVVAVLLAVATTLAMGSYLRGQLDSDVRASLERAANAPAAPFVDPRPDDRDRDQPPEVRGQQVSTLTAYFSDDGSSRVGDVIRDRSSGSADRQLLDAEALAVLATVPRDGRVHEVRLDDLGEYRVAVSRTGRHTVAGLPTSEVDDAVASLVGVEATLVLLGVAVAAAAGLLVVRRQLRPLTEVAATAHAVTALPLASGAIGVTERVPARLTDERTEVGQVGGALNSLLAHVESSLDARHRSEQQVRQFVADASHELRTPLSTIVGYTELARRHPDDAGTAVTALGKVEEESARMTALVEDLLLLARLDAGRPLVREPVDLTRLLLEAVSDARVVAPDHRWRLELPETSIEVLGDELRLHQVVTNLLANARRHTPAGTTVTVTARPHGFAVHDDGPGFPPGLVGTDQRGAFERFARGDAARHREGSGGGAGLGLALVEAIVTAHGGSVSLNSEPGDTTIRVTLPTE